MADALSTNLQNAIASNASWTTPCTFNRMYKMPIDSKSCFDTFSDLTNYLNNPESTAYPGMYVAVTGKEDTKAGPYILMSDGTKLNPIPMGVVSGDVSGLTKLDKDEGYSLEDVGDLLNDVVDILKAMKKS